MRAISSSLWPASAASAANIAAYFWVGTGMMLRSPVNFDLATIDQVSLVAQAELRDFRRRGVR
jgi:hypothetical protein